MQQREAHPAASGAAPRPSAHVSPQERVPDFLQLLTTHPEQAKREFIAFADTVLQTEPPAPYRDLPRADRERVYSDIVHHCLDRDCAVLRSYEDRGYRFALWFKAVARNVAREYLRRERTRWEREVSIDSPRDDAQHGREVGIEHVVPDGMPSPYRIVANRELLDIVLEACRSLSRKCRLLLWAAAKGLKPVEMAALVGLAPQQNKKVGTDLSYCRKRLREILVQSGHQLSEFVSTTGA
jgi:DNA-directed RNA polymerase specialized sigma24 family protein